MARFRLLGLGVIALALFFLLPFDIRGYVYYLNTRYAHLAAALLVACVPATRPNLHGRCSGQVSRAQCCSSGVMGRGFRAFFTRGPRVDALVAATAPKPRVMGLSSTRAPPWCASPSSFTAPRVLARARGGITNFSFALTPHSPLRYSRIVPPPSPPSGGRTSSTTPPGRLLRSLPRAGRPPFPHLRRAAPDGAGHGGTRERAGWCGGGSA